MFEVSTEQLTELHDPKSLVQFKRLFADPQALYTGLKTDPQDGLTALDDDDRREWFGENRLPEKKSKSFLQLAWQEMHDKVLILLSVAAVVSLALGLYEYFGQPPQYDEEGHAEPRVEWVEGVAIIVAILIVVLVGAANNFQKEMQFNKLNKKKDDRNVVVIRESKELVISVYDLVVGDILTLQTGDVLPVDAVLVSGSCELDESSITGESHSIKKATIQKALKIYEDMNISDKEVDIGTKGIPDPYLISGSKIISGLGTCVVTAVGTHSIHGRMMQSLQVETEQTPLQARLNNLADGITKYGILASLVLFIVLFAKFLSDLPAGHKYHDLTAAQKGSKFLNIVIVAITLIVVAVPEGLPLAVTLALAFATTRMAKDSNLVRVLRACETMGGATAICSDKTGTLTENSMRVVKGVIGDQGFSHGADEQVSSPTKLNEIEHSVLVNIVLNSTAFENKQPPAPIIQKKSKWNPFSSPQLTIAPKFEPFIGSKTETALLMFAQSSLTLSDNLHTFRSNPKKIGVDEVVQVIPFESTRKWGAIVVKTDDCYRLYIKGAAELLFHHCSSKYINGDLVKMNQQQKRQIDAKIEEYASQALRTITLAHRDFSHWDEDLDEDTLLDTMNDELVFDCVVGIQDPLRPGVRDAVSQCFRAGVSVRMVTGDNIITARAIALNCGILTNGDPVEACIEGPRFRKLATSQQVELIPNLKVLARSSPEDKRLLVSLLKKHGDVVAVTGDGTNDSPALKLADVGFAMGISGTEVAREASDIILMTDDFSAIVNAIKWGRCVSTSIKKFIQFQLTVNITAVVLTFVSAVASSDNNSVLTAVQLLWVNLIMDTLAALALATDKPDNTILDRKPDGRKSTLISVSMWKMIIGQSLLQLTVTFVLHFGGAKIFFGDRPLTPHEKTQLDAMTFNTFVWLQFFKLWVTRKLDEADGLTTVSARCTSFNLNFFEHLFRNYYFLAIAGLIGGCQVLIMFIGGSAFSVTRQTGPMWATALICGMLSLPWGVVIRIIPDEWVLAIFPSKAFHFMSNILTLDFLRSSSRKKRISLNADDIDSEPMWSDVPAFKKTKEDIMFVRESGSDGSFNPWNFYRRLRGNSMTDDEEGSIGENHHALAALTMVPTVVGGAIAGWSPLAQANEKKNS